MAKEKIQKHDMKKEETKTSGACADPKCPFHGGLKTRGRIFQGVVISKFPKRIAIEFERTVFVPKYERFSKSKTKLHAHLSDCLANEVQIGDFIEIQECRQLSKIISFVVMKKLRSGKIENKQTLEENQ